MSGLTFMRWSRRDDPLTKKICVGAILSGLAWALSITLAAGALMCAWVLLSAGPVYNFGVFVAVGAMLGAFAGGAAAGRAAGILGLWHGFLAGSLYGALLMSLITAGSIGGFSTSELTARVAFMGLAGGLGGLIGINSLNHRTSKNNKTRKVSFYG